MTNSAECLRDHLFGAISSEPRRRILERLATGPCSVTELTTMVGLSMPTVSKHLTILEESGLIVRVAESRQKMCHLRPWPLLQGQEWLVGVLSGWERGARTQPSSPSPVSDF